MSIKVFLADDHAIVLEGLVNVLLKQVDIAVVGTAPNGRAAVSGVRETQPDVVVLDISMPELDGIEAARQILEHKPGTAVVILSMHAGAQHIFHALEAGARGYILKESAAREIIEAVRTVHLGRRYLGARVAEVIADGLGDRSGASPLQSLSKREREIIKLVTDGHSSVEIGVKLNLSPKTVDSYRSRLMQKLHISDIPALVKFAIQHGLTSLD